MSPGLKSLKGTCFCLALLILTAAAYSPPARAQAGAVPFHQLGITANNFMFYHADLEAAADFYTAVLGLEKVLDYGTAVMFQLAETSYITLVRGNREKHNIGGPRPVTVTLLTDDLASWHAHLSRQGLELVHLNMADTELPMNSFVAIDPAGYYLQFATLNRHPQNTRILPRLALLDPVTTTAEGRQQASPPLSIKATITSFYYRDLDAARDFYGKELGFEPVIEHNRSTTYHTSSSGYFRLVGGKHGLHQPSKDISQKKGVMLSLYTNKVDAWFDDIAPRRNIVMRTPDMVDIEHLREFSFNDPGDYAVEFNFFKSTEANRVLLEQLDSQSCFPPLHRGCRQAGQVPPPEQASE